MKSVQVFVSTFSITLNHTSEISLIRYPVLQKIGFLRLETGYLSDKKIKGVSI